MKKNLLLLLCILCTPLIVFSAEEVTERSGIIRIIYPGKD